MQWVQYFHANGVIDSMNRQHNFELRLFDSWPTKSFWRKTFVEYEGIVFTEFYLCNRQNGYLESFVGGDGSCETLVQFLDRFIGKVLDPLFDSPVVQSPSPVKGAAGKPEPHAPARGAKRSRGRDHFHEHGKKVKLAKGGGGQQQIAGSCKVCKSQGRRMSDKQGGFPLTKTYCTYCQGFVHGRGAKAPYDKCWEFHLCNAVGGLDHSGDGV